MTRFPYIASLFLALMLFCCTQVERDNPYDPDGVNYNFGGNEPSSDSDGDGDEPSSSSELGSLAPSSSSSVRSSSSLAASSSSLVPSSSSLTQSSSSSVRSSSSLKPLSSSSVAPSSSSLSVSISSSLSVVVSSSSVATSGTFLDERNERNYRWVKIGTQIWFAENLNFAPGSGTFISCDTYDCATYGRLYDWETAMTVCPAGWHLPSQAEWNTLSSYVQSTSGCKDCDARLLKKTSGWNNNGNGTDTYGFSALPGGHCNSGDSFSVVGSDGDWWSASEGYSNLAYYRNMSNNSDYAYWYRDSKSILKSVRCLEDSK